jgi:hypothetical protein
MSYEELIEQMLLEGHSLRVNQPHYTEIKLINRLLSEASNYYDDGEIYDDDDYDDDDYDGDGGYLDDESTEDSFDDEYWQQDLNSPHDDLLDNDDTDISGEEWKLGTEYDRELDDFDSDFDGGF